MKIFGVETVSAALAHTCYDPRMPNDAGRHERAIRSEPHGPHWIAWVEDAAGKPEQSVVLVGLTKDEAEERAKRWRDEQT